MSVMTETDKVNIRAQVERLHGYKRRHLADLKGRVNAWWANLRWEHVQLEQDEENRERSKERVEASF